LDVAFDTDFGRRDARRRYGTAWLAVAAQTATTASAALDVLRTFISNAVMASAKAEAARRL